MFERGMSHFDHDDATREVLEMVHDGKSVRGACREVARHRGIPEATLRSVYYRKVTPRGELVKDVVEAQLQETASDIAPIEFTDSRPRHHFSRPEPRVTLTISRAHYAAARALGESDSTDLAVLSPAAKRFKQDLPSEGQIVRLGSGRHATTLIKALNPGHKENQLPTRVFPAGEYRFLFQLEYGRSAKVTLERIVDAGAEAPQGA